MDQLEKSQVVFIVRELNVTLCKFYIISIVENIFQVSKYIFS